MGNNCSDPDVYLAALVFLRGCVAPLFGGGNSIARLVALYRLGPVLLVQLQRALGVYALRLGRRWRVGRASDCRNTHGRLPLVVIECNHSHWP